MAAAMTTGRRRQAFAVHQDRVQEDVLRSGRRLAAGLRHRSTNAVTPVPGRVPSWKQQSLHAGGPTIRLPFELGDLLQVAQPVSVAEGAAGLSPPATDVCRHRNGRAQLQRHTQSTHRHVPPRDYSATSLSPSTYSQCV